MDSVAKVVERIKTDFGSNLRMLSDYERSFLDDVKKRKTLTTKQAKFLIRIAKNGFCIFNMGPDSGQYGSEMVEAIRKHVAGVFEREEGDDNHFQYMTREELADN